MRISAPTAPAVSPAAQLTTSEQRQALIARMDASAKADDERFDPTSFRFSLTVPPLAWNVPDVVSNYLDWLGDDTAEITAEGKFADRIYFVSGFHDVVDDAGNYGAEFVFQAFDAQGNTILSGSAGNFSYSYDPVETDKK